MNERSIRVAGIGNALAGDDAVGLHVAENIRQQHWAAVECVAQSQPGPALFEGLGCNDLLIVIDACRTGAGAGSVLRFSPGDLQHSGLRHTSTHGLGLADWLGFADQLGESPPEMLVYGIEANQCRMGEGLSDVVAAAIPALLELIRSDIDAVAGKAVAMDNTSH